MSHPNFFFTFSPWQSNSVHNMGNLNPDWEQINKHIKKPQWNFIPAGIPELGYPWTFKRKTCKSLITEEI